MLIIKYYLILKLLLYPLLIFGVQEEAKIKKDLRSLLSELRCMVCQNQSLLDSDSDLANDMKKIIYEKLKEGKSKTEVKDFLVSRYGEFILFRPLFNKTNLLLWLGPILSFFIIGFVGFKKTRIKIKK
tara:strand:+ start:542 stop:925 length:384 start_codon:yes stop_codon:yes gene_type:complete